MFSRLHERERRLDVLSEHKQLVLVHRGHLRSTDKEAGHIYRARATVVALFIEAEFRICIYIHTYMYVRVYTPV